MQPVNPEPCTHPDCKPLGPCPGCGAAEAPGWVDGWHGWTCGSKNMAHHGDPVQFAQSINCAKAEGAASITQQPVPHKCPKCDGQGIVSKPPWVAGDVFQWTSSQTTFTCDVCHGEKIIWSKP